MRITVSPARRAIAIITAIMVVAIILSSGSLGAVGAQSEHQPTNNSSSDFNCEETTEIDIIAGDEGNLTRTVPVGYLNYSDRVDRIASQIETEYMDQPGVYDIVIEQNPNKTVCGRNVSQVGVRINPDQFNGSIPTQLGGVNIAIHEWENYNQIQQVQQQRRQSPSNNGSNDSSENTTAETSSETESVTATTDSSSSGKAKQPNNDGDGEDGAADGRNGKAKMGDGSDGDDTMDGGNGKAKAD